MSGGATPPAEEWLRSLPVYSEGMRGIGVFTGVANGVSNLIIHIEESTPKDLVGVFKDPISQGHWKFDISGNRFEVDTTAGTSWAPAIVQGSGMEDVLYPGAVVDVSVINRADITFKLNPI